MKCRLCLLAVAIGALTLGMTSLGAAAADVEHPADDTEKQLALLRAEVTLLRDTLEHRNQEIARLKEEIQTLKAELARVQPSEQSVDQKATDPEPPAPVLEVPETQAKQVVLSPREYKALPVYRANLPKKPPVWMTAGVSRAAEGSPMGFTRMELNAVGHVGAVRLVRILSEDAATIEVDLVEASTGHSPAINGGPSIRRTIILEGMSTKGQADNSDWSLHIWLKVVDTRNLNGTTYFVAWPIVQAGNASPPPRTGTQR